jgi:PAS domain S-box-containing protein
MMPTPVDSLKLDLSHALGDLAAPAYVVDRDGRLRWLNEAYRELFGDRRGSPFVDSVAPEQRQLARADFARQLASNTTTIYDVVVLDRAGERLTLRVTWAPLRQNDEVVGVLGIGIPMAQTIARTDSVLDDLTPRQLEVLRLLAEGIDTSEIARRLGVADETVRNHIRALLRATGAHSRLEVVLLGLRHGVVTPAQGADPRAPEQ